MTEATLQLVIVSVVLLAVIQAGLSYSIVKFVLTGNVTFNRRLHAEETSGEGRGPRNLRVGG